jgi:hypothetical protein
MGYRLAMVQTLMKSFDVDAALLPRFSEFNPITLTVKTTFVDVDEQLDSVKADLGIDQGWTADLENKDRDRVDVVSHCEALAMTLRDPIKDVDSTAHSGPSCRLEFLHSMGNLTNNSEATIRQHILQEKVLKHIELVNENCYLENNLHETQGKMASILAQNQLLQEQLLAFNQGLNPPVVSTAPNNEARDKEDVPMSIRGGRGTSHSQVLLRCDDCVLLFGTSKSLKEPVPLFVNNTNWPRGNKTGERGNVLAAIGANSPVQEGPVQKSKSPELASRALLPLGEAHVPYPPGSGIHNGSYYFCLGWMTEDDIIHPVPGFDPMTQKQVFCAIWRPRSMNFNHVLDTVPRGTPDHPKVQRWMQFCSEEIVDADGRQLYFASKEDLTCHISHRQESQQTFPTIRQLNTCSSASAVLSVGRLVQQLEP